MSPAHDGTRRLSQIVSKTRQDAPLRPFMPVRYPPPDRIPQVVRGAKSSRQSRIVSYEEPSVGFGRRVGRRLLSAPVLIPLALITAFLFVVLVYYWTVFSARIDNLLRGEIFTSSAGI